MKKRSNRNLGEVRITVDIGPNMVLDTTTGKVEPKSCYHKLDPFNNFPTSPSVRIFPEFNQFDNDFDYDDEEEYDEDEEYEDDNNDE